MKYGKSAAQVILRWHVQQGNIVIPGSKTPVHIAQNLDVFDFELTDGDMAKMATFDQGDSIFHHTPEMLERFAAWHPDAEGQK